MNPTLEVIENRRSIRVYDPTPLSQAEQDAILNAALRAPTAGAMMLYTIIEVADPAAKDQLAVTCDHQPFIAAAPYLLLFLADYQRWMDLYAAAGCEQPAAELGIPVRPPAEGDLLLALMDALIAAQTAVIAANRWASARAILETLLKTGRPTRRSSTCRVTPSRPRWSASDGLLKPPPTRWCHASSASSSSTRTATSDSAPPS